MSRPTNWGLDRARGAMRKYGSESRKGGLPYGLFVPPPKPRPSKAAMRAEAERLVAAFLEKKNADECTVERDK